MRRIDQTKIGGILVGNDRDDGLPRDARAKLAVLMPDYHPDDLDMIFQSMEDTCEAGIPLVMAFGMPRMFAASMAAILIVGYEIGKAESA
jgi:hypothetical protein